jgi:outer membrane protein assembly factor BamB
MPIRNDLFSPLVASVTVFLATASALSASDWPWWRGPDRNGVAASDLQPPVVFSDKESVKWIATVPGRGHGSPIVVGSRVLLQTADEKEQSQSVLCLDRKTGEQIWLKKVHQGVFPKTNKRASHASGTPAYDGERIFVNFVIDGAAHTTALDEAGQLLWQKKICDYVVHQGYGSSPSIYENLVIVSADTKIGGAICAFDRKSGDEVWRVARPKFPNYASPVILKVAGREQLLFSGCEAVTSLNPKTGEKFWEVEGSTTECVTTIVTDGERIFTSGGYPKNHVSAVNGDGSGEVVWENISRVYVPSMLVKDGYLYAVMDGGVAVCWKSDTGDRMWKERLGGTFSGSPVLVGDHIYAGNGEGEFFVFKADPKKFEVVAENQLGDEVFSTPTIVDGQIFIRVAHHDEDGARVEKLYCLGKK